MTYSVLEYSYIERDSLRKVELCNSWTPGRGYHGCKWF